MPKSYWTKIQTPNGLKYFRADEVTDELLQKIKDSAGGLFIAKYQETTPADVFAAIDLGKTVYVSLSTQGTGPFLQTSVTSKDAQLSTTYARFTGIFEHDGVISEYTTECNPTGWESVTDTPIAVQSNLAPKYDSLQTYAVDDIVHRGSELYRCTTAIDTPEDWTPAHWTQTTVAAELGKTFFATMFVTPYSEIKAAYDAGRSIIAVNGHAFYHMFDYNESAGYERFRFSLVQGNTFLLWTCNKTGYDGTHGWNPQPDFNSCANQGDIAPRYSSESTYDVGDLAYSDGGMLYRCTTVISTPETWNSNHWTSTTVADEFKRTSNIDTWTEVQISSVSETVADFHWCKMYYNDTLKMYSLNFWCTISNVSSLALGWNNLFEVDIQDAPNILNFACRSRREHASTWVSENLLEQIGFDKVDGKVYLRLYNSDTASSDERLYYAPTISFPATYFSGT